MEPNQLPQNIRRILVQEIERWQKEGLIPDKLAANLRARYDFDFRPAPPPEALPAPQAAPPVAPPAPPLTLSRTLLSETSVKIALYLGAFFVIAAALILAALVEVLRLPVLLSVALLFGGGALALKRRLPQPSFILYLVFSALLPITAGVLADLLDLSGKAATGYWCAILGGMALLWAFSTRLYASRFFSLTALLALDAALVMAGRLADDPPAILFLFMLTLSSLAGLGGVALLKRWQGQRLALPVFLLAQVQQGMLLAAAAVSLLINLVTDSNEWGLLAASTWVLTALFALLSNLLFPFILYPWATAAALMPVAWLAVVRPETGLEVRAITLSAWGMLFAVAGDLMHLARERVRAHALPFSLAAIPLLLIGASLGLAHDRWLGFALFLGSAALLSVLHVLRGRAWLWAAALGFGLAAYFTFFQLPFAEAISEQICPQIAGATLLLLLPDLLLPSSRRLPAWRWPLRGWAVLTGLAALLSSLPAYFFGTRQEAGMVLLSLGLLGVLYLVYAIRLRSPATSILFPLHATLALALVLDFHDVEAWLPILTGLAVVFYGCGVFLSWRSLPPWSHVFRWSGLALAGILALAAFGYEGNDRSIYVALLASLFLAETFRTPWLEMAPPLVYSLALGMALGDARVEPAAFYAAGVALLFLGLDLLYTRLKDRGDSRWATRAFGGMAAALTPLLAVLPEFDPGAGALACGGLAVLFVVQALVYRQPRLGYAAALFVTLSVLFASLEFFEQRWLWAMIATALAFYAGSLPLERRAQPAWGGVLRNSALGLASLTALSAPFEGTGLIASLPIALAASLWAVEAFRRRNVWLGFPANGFYLMAYFVILATLEVDQPQFYTTGAAALGLLMHYLLVRAGSRTGAFLTGMVSQLVLIGASYIQFVQTEQFPYFVVMFIQSLVVLTYGIVVRSRSLVVTPIVLVVVGVVTVVFGALRGLSLVILIGCSGIGLILLGIAALLLRERISSLREHLKDWRA